MEVVITFRCAGSFVERGSCSTGRRRSRSWCWRWLRLRMIKMRKRSRLWCWRWLRRLSWSRWGRWWRLMPSMVMIIQIMTSILIFSQECSWHWHWHWYSHRWLDLDIDVDIDIDINILAGGSKAERTAGAVSRAGKAGAGLRERQLITRFQCHWKSIWGWVGLVGGVWCRV